MKIRMGYVSNSSSSSFIVLIPEDFTIDNINFSEYEEEMEGYDTNEADVRKAFERLKDNYSLYEDENYGEMNTLKDILSEFIISEVDVSSDRGELVSLDINKVKKIINRSQK